MKAHIFLKKAFLPHHTACGILVSWWGFEYTPSAMEALNPNHWTAREVPNKKIEKKNCKNANINSWYSNSCTY